MPDKTPQKKVNHSEPPKLFADSESPELVPIPDLEILPPDTIIDGKYKILSCLDESVLAVIYKVEHVLKNKEYALKLFAAEFSDSQLQRFQSDAKAASLLEHPNTATLADFGLQDNKQPYCVMEIVEGISLADYLNRCGRLTYDDIFSVFLPLCWALQDAHEKGIIHRNVKPSNIMLIGEQGNWHSKLLDFSTAKLSEGGRKPRNQTVRISANPLYLSPEQCSGKKLDCRTDIYSLGCVLFEAITARPPFSGANPEQTKKMHLNDVPPTLREASLGREFPEDLECIIQTMLAKDPRHRYTSASQVAENLMRLKLSAQLRIKVKPKESTGKISQENTIVVLCLTTILALGLALCFWLQLRQPTQEFVHTKQLPRETLETFIQSTPSDFVGTPIEDNVQTFEEDNSVTPFFRQSRKINGKEFRKYVFPPSTIGTLIRPNGGRIEANGEQEVEWLGPLQFETAPNIFARCPKILKRFREDEIRSVEFTKNKDLYQQDLVDLHRYKYLDEVSFDHSYFNDDGLKYLAVLPDLTSLSMWSTSVSAFGLQRFSSLSKLKKLAVSEMNDIGLVLNKLRGSTKLENLQLQYCTDMNETDFETIAAFPNLKKLAFSKHEEIEPSLFDALAKSKSLQELDIHHERLTEAAIQSLGKLKNLRTLELGRNKVDQSQRTEIFRLLPNCHLVLH